MPTLATSALVHSPAEIIQQLLIDRGFADNPDTVPLGAWPCYSTNEPSSPDNVVTVYDTLGMDDGRTMDDGELQQHYGWQFRVRGKTDAGAWAKLSGLRASITESVYQGTVTLGTSVYTVWNFAKVGNILSLKSDSPSTKRRLFTLNGTVAIRQVS